MMPTPPRDARVLVFAPGLRNAELIVGRLSRTGIVAHVAPDNRAFAAALAEGAETYGAVIVTSGAMHLQAATTIADYQEREPVWSALPIVVLSPAGEVPVAPWRNAIVLTQPTRAAILLSVVRRALEARAQQFLAARANVRLERIAYRDALTGLPNRTALYERIRDLQRERRGPQSGFAAIFLDIDAFKAINDRYGHAVGDDALRRVAAHIASTVRATDFVARWGGDEFIALLVGVDGTTRLDDTVRRLTEAVPLDLERVPERVSVALSVGFLGEIGPDQTPDEILSIADARMYAHKRQKRP